MNMPIYFSCSSSSKGQILPFKASQGMSAKMPNISCDINNDTLGYIMIPLLALNST